MSDMLEKFIAVGNKVELQPVKRVRSFRKESENDQETEDAVKTEEDGSDDSEEKSSTASQEEWGSENKIYVSKVFDIISDERISILMPMEKTKLILLPVDAEYDMCFYTTHGLYQCNARVMDRYKDNNIFVLILDLTSNLRKFQRRQYYRFSCALNMDSRELEEEEVSTFEKRNVLLEPGFPLKRSIVVDISGGGLRFVSDYRYEKDSMILCKYSLIVNGTNKEYNLAAKVLNVNEIDNRPGIFEHRVQYVNMDVDEREEIIKYIFDEERKSRHKHKDN